MTRTEAELQQQLDALTALNKKFLAGVLSYTSALLDTIAQQNALIEVQKKFITILTKKASETKTN